MSKRNGGIELRLQYTAATIGLFPKQDGDSRLRRESEDEELEEKILKPSTTEPLRPRIMLGSVTAATAPQHPGFINYKRQRGQRTRRMRADIFHFLEGCRTTPSKIYHIAVFLLIMVSLALAIVITTDDYKHNASLFYTMLGTEYLLLVIFVVEYMLRIWSSTAQGHYGDPCGRVRLGGNLLFYWFDSGQASRYRHKNGKELITCWYMSFIMIIFVSFMVYALETDPKEYTINNLFNGFYWSVVSLTSIGYGDISPNTAVAKILVCLVALVGTAFIAMPAGIIGSGFALQVAEHAKEKHANRKRRPAAVLIQCFWRRFAGDHDLHATWLRHMINRESRRQTKQRMIKSHAVLHGNIPISAVTTTGEIREDQPVSNGNFPIQLKKLTLAEKNALRFIRRLQIRAALKMFKQARRPYDERDILDQFASGQIEMFAKLRQLGSKVENVSTHIGKPAMPEEFNQKIGDLEEEISVLRDDMTETKQLLREILKVISEEKTPPQSKKDKKSDSTTV
eukprot:gene12155-13409_t